MRPLRFLVTLFSFIFAFFLLISTGSWRHSELAEFEVHTGGFGTYFNWRTPSSLFPPSAIISLTDDNSTFFLARPAAFGPLLPAKSLSGQLWIGSGFGDDHIGHGGSGAGAEGELGCSDVPGWYAGSYNRASPWSGKRSTLDTKFTTDKEAAIEESSKRILGSEDDEDEEETEELPTERDGTDDHLHHPLPASDDLRTTGDLPAKSRKAAHADIQSLQESAEIAGKVVLLSRGGCGFLEKAKWVQRRGGVALIVGDDIRGGPLVTMYARGDTSNITIPALFTSHTTAHLLSSLIPSGGALADLEEIARLGLALGAKASRTSGKPKQLHRAGAKRGDSTTTAAAGSPTKTQRAQSRKTDGRKSSVTVESTGTGAKTKEGWFGFFYASTTVTHGLEDTRRPPSSGKNDWVLQEDFEDEISPQGKPRRHQKSPSRYTPAHPRKPESGAVDSFKIGVHDWRDPDLIATELETSDTSTSTTATSQTKTKNPATASPLQGGSITPGSGEYEDSSQGAAGIFNWQTKKPNRESASAEHRASELDEPEGWFGRIVRLKTGDEIGTDNDAAKKMSLPQYEREFESGEWPASAESHHRKIDVWEQHEGLWVTLTPTSMSSSPFLDTLLVLVVSPLVTLTVVYALLLLRSRIRRRRWRAPKSVVERLPVRTYQTMPSTASTTSTATTPSSRSPNALTPLLPHTSSRPARERSRPRAQTVPDIPQTSTSRADTFGSPSPEHIEEKRAAGLSEWRRRYGGKQRECVVCLEEYIDGVSRVMSLPCGHEFHAECITPWLTTRRRTCPICKGDVVRSLAREAEFASPSSASQMLQLPEEDEEDVQEQAAVTVNDDPEAQRPVSREDEALEDLERGIVRRDRSHDD